MGTTRYYQKPEQRIKESSTGNYTQLCFLSKIAYPFFCQGVGKCPGIAACCNFTPTGLGSQVFLSFTN